MKLIKINQVAAVLILLLISSDVSSTLLRKTKKYTKEQILDKVKKYNKYIEKDSCMITYMTLVNLFSLDADSNVLKILVNNEFELKRTKEKLSFQTIASKFSDKVKPSMKLISDEEYVDQIINSLNDGYMVGIDFVDGVRRKNHFLQVFKPERKTSKIMVLQSFEGDYHLNEWINNNDFEPEWDEFRKDLLVLVNDSSTIENKLNSLFNISFRGEMRKNEEFKKDSDEWWGLVKSKGLIVRFNKFLIDLEREPNIKSLRENSKTYKNESDKKKK